MTIEADRLILTRLEGNTLADALHAGADRLYVDPALVRALAVALVGSHQIVVEAPSPPAPVGPPVPRP